MNSNILLIAEDTLKTYSNLNKNTFGDWILPAILEAQEMGLMPIIGECLYNKICELVADGSINDVLFTAYKDLLDDYIQPYLIYKTLSNIIPILNAKMANLGVVVTNDEHVVNLTQSESDLLKAYYSERCDFYTKRLQDFIKSNQSAFPEISCGCGNMQPNLESDENSVSVWLGGSRGKKIGNSNNCICSSTEVTQSDYQSGFTDGVEFQKRKLEITAVTENGRYIREDGYSEVVVNVAQTGHTDEEMRQQYDNGVADGTDIQKGKLSAITLTQNGEYSREDGYSAITVNVPQTGHTEEEMVEQYQSGYTSGETHQKALLSAITITQNGSYERENGYSAVTVNVAGQEPSLQTLSVTANGEYFPEQGYDGFSSVDVNVPTGSTINNQDKSITITANTATTITYDNGYTGLGNVGINVNVPQTGHTDEELAQAYASGYTNGYNDGYADGYRDGSSAATGYSNDYLSFSILSGGDIKWISTSNNPENFTTIEYKINGGMWKSITSSKEGASFNVNNGDIVRFRGLNSRYYYDSFSGSSAVFNVQGNIMSLIYGSNFATATTLTNDSVFALLFTECTGLTSAENLILPATTLTDSCYEEMFLKCTHLTKAPELPATYLAPSCYKNMFADCASLTTAPELPATTIRNRCYEGMFVGCTSLTTAPTLPATDINGSAGEACYRNMFKDCISLTTAPDLPGNIIGFANLCYSGMFSGCTNLQYIKCLTLGMGSATSPTFEWVSGVAATGTFVKHPNATWWETGISGIPSGWTVVDNS